MPEDSVTPLPAGTQTVVIQQKSTSTWTWILGIALVVTMLVCMLLFFAVLGLSASTTAAVSSDGVIEKHESGNRSAGKKVAVIDIVGTISPPLTGRVIAQTEHALDDNDVEAVLLRIDSPGGLVADSHQIYHKLKQLSDAKPTYVSFGRLAASGGYYVAMGAGPETKIFSEPTTWTGSIGVIIPHYEVNELADKIGVEFEPLKTGPYKDALSPFRDLTPDETAVWDEIMDDAFSRFKGVISENRSGMTAEAVGDAATGQIFTTGQALERGLVDVEGFEEDALAALQADHNLKDAHVVRYSTQPTFFDVLSGTASMTVGNQEATASNFEAVAFERLSRAMTPQPLYLFGWPTAMIE